jgi:hypothetical protein
MANANGWGDGASNNTIGWGQGANNAIGWGDIHADSWAGATDIVGITPAPSLLLDTYTGASVAYSLRKLRTDYSGNAIRVRRSSDNTEQDFGFSGNDLDTASLLTFCGAGNGFVTRWYDQSGNTNNATQVTAVSQPRIVTSGVLDTLNNKPTIFFDEKWLIATIPNTTSNGCSTFQVTAQNTPSRAVTSLYVNSTSVELSLLGLNSSQKGNFQYRTTISDGASVNLNQLYMLSSHIESNTLRTVYLNNILDITQTNNLSGFTANRFLINLVRTIDVLTGKSFHSEVILYNTLQVANRTAIETNINDYYSIY